MFDLNWLDLCIVFILFLFCLLGFMKGFTHRILSLLSWGGAIYLTLHFFPTVRPFIGQYVSSKMATTVITASFLFIALLILFKLITTKLSNLIQKGPLGALDRILGVAFGLMIGLLVLALVGIITNVFVAKHHYPAAMNSSKTWPYIQQGQSYIEAMQPLEKRELLKKKDLLRKLKKARKEQRTLARLKRHQELGYKKDDRKKLDALVGRLEGNS